MPYPWRKIGIWLVAPICGALIAWVSTAVIIYLVFAHGGYTTEALVELPSWAFPGIGATGALIGLVIAMFGGLHELPRWVQGTALGSLVGVGAVVGLTLTVGQTPYSDNGLLYGVPVGLLIGGVIGFVASKRR